MAGHDAGQVLDEFEPHAEICMRVAVALEFLISSVTRRSGDASVPSWVRGLRRREDSLEIATRPAWKGFKNCAVTIGTASFPAI